MQLLERGLRQHSRTVVLACCAHVRPADTGSGSICAAYIYAIGVAPSGWAASASSPTTQSGRLATTSDATAQPLEPMDKTSDSKAPLPSARDKVRERPPAHAARPCWLWPFTLLPTLAHPLRAAAAHDPHRLRMPLPYIEQRPSDAQTGAAPHQPSPRSPLRTSPLRASPLRTASSRSPT